MSSSSGKKSKSNDIVYFPWYLQLGLGAVVYLIFAFFLLSGASSDDSELSTLKRKGIDVQGIVREKDYDHNTKVEDFYKLTGGYTAHDGREYAFTFYVTESFYERTDIGESIDLIYNPDNLWQVRLKSTVMAHQPSGYRKEAELSLYCGGFFMLLWWVVSTIRRL